MPGSVTVSGAGAAAGADAAGPWVRSPGLGAGSSVSGAVSAVAWAGISGSVEAAAGSRAGASVSRIAAAAWAGADPSRGWAAVPDEGGTASPVDAGGRWGAAAPAGSMGAAVFPWGGRVSAVLRASRGSAAKGSVVLSASADLPTGSVSSRRGDGWVSGRDVPRGAGCPPLRVAAGASPCSRSGVSPASSRYTSSAGAA